MAAMLRESVVVVVAVAVAVAVVRKRPQGIPLVMITMRKSIHGFPFLPYMGMGLRRSSAIIYTLRSLLVPVCFFTSFSFQTYFSTALILEGAKTLWYQKNKTRHFTNLTEQREFTR